jgi:hypothetical protein
MRGVEKTLLAFCGAVIDFAWLYAWAAFSMIPLGRGGLPFLDAAAIFAIAAALTRVHAGRGLKIIVVGLLQGTGLAATALRTIYIMGDRTISFLDSQWLTGFFSASHSAGEWLGLGIALFFGSAFWLGGAFFAVRPRTHQKICSRFDIGLAAFFALVLIKLTLAVKGSIFTGDTMTGPLAFVFFFFGLIAIGMTRTSGRGSPGLVRGHRKLGVVMGFICVVFSSAMGLIAFFQQPLARAAGAGYGFLKDGTASVGAIFLWFIKFLYTPGQGKLREDPSGAGGGVSGHLLPPDSAPWLETAGSIIAWFFGTFLGIIMLIVVVGGAVFVVKWLSSRTKRTHGRSRRLPAPNALLRAWHFIALLARKTARSLKGHRTAADIYRALAGWSRRSGIRQSRSETPSEFSSRLSGVFPSLRHEIKSITEAFNREFYGETALTREEMTLLRTSRRRLSSPSYWPARLKTLIAGQITPRY